MRARASAELHIGGFTNVQLAHPVLDAAGAPDDDTAARALLFFTAASLAHGAAIARVHCGRGPRGAMIAAFARRSFRGVVARIDDESLGLLAYFDLYLHPAAAVGPKVGARLVRSVARALRPTAEP
jgi:hypothetical protein